jgi:hypothetical protein
MTPSSRFILAALSLYALLAAAGAAWEVLAGRNVGPILFRLPPASMAEPPRSGRLSPILLILAVLLTLPAKDLALTIFFLSLTVMHLQNFHPRRHTRRWLVLASGLLGLTLAAMLPPIGLGLFPGSSFGLTWGLAFVLSALFLAGGPSTIRDGLSGPIVCERGIEILGALHPWSRVTVMEWAEGGDGFVLRISIPPGRLQRVLDTSCWCSRPGRRSSRARDLPRRARRGRGGTTPMRWT